MEKAISICKRNDVSINTLAIWLCTGGRGAVNILINPPFETKTFTTPCKYSSIFLLCPCFSCFLLHKHKLSPIKTNLPNVILELTVQKVVFTENIKGRKSFSQFVVKRVTSQCHQCKLEFFFKSTWFLLKYSEIKDKII